MLKWQNYQELLQLACLLVDQEIKNKYYKIYNNAIKKYPYNENRFIARLAGAYDAIYNDDETYLPTTLEMDKTNGNISTNVK